MKCGEITLMVHGRQRTFSEEELVSILEKYFSNEGTTRKNLEKISKGPIENQIFEVKPFEIDQNLFKKEREDAEQEKTRKLIWEAFIELKYHPEKYGRNFKTMMPKKEGQENSVADLKKQAREIGDHNADWVEQALEWAQRICNGETWEEICNHKDTANWYRLVVWKNGYSRLVGGSRFTNAQCPPTNVSQKFYNSYNKLRYTIPLVISY